MWAAYADVVGEWSSLGYRCNQIVVFDANRALDIASRYPYSELASGFRARGGGLFGVR